VANVHREPMLYVYWAFTGSDDQVSYHSATSGLGRNRKPATMPEVYCLFFFGPLNEDLDRTRNIILMVRFQVLMTTSMKMAVLWVAASHSLVHTD
jgi:hypothetical protein